MIVEFTEQEKNQIDATEAKYEKKLNDLDKLKDSLQPGAWPDTDKYFEGINGKDNPEEWKAALNRESKELTAHEATGSDEWRAAKSKWHEINQSLNNESTALFKRAEKRQFDELGGDLTAILEDAKIQTTRSIHNLFQYSAGDPTVAYSVYMKEGTRLLSAARTSESIRGCLHLHIEALKVDEDLSNKLTAYINGIIRRSEYIYQIPKEVAKYFNLASTQVTNTTKKILNNPNRIGSARKGQVKQMENYLTKDSIITYKGNDSTLTFTLERTKELFTRKMQNGSKVFNFLLQKLNEQNRQEVTKFQLIELVDNGIYANKDSAARGLKTVLEKIYAISIEGITTDYSGLKKEKKTFIKSRIISAFKVSHNECIVNITPIIRESMTYITLLPNWSYTLNENSYMLLDYIFYLARQNYKQIKDKGSFNVSIETIRIHLGLPTIEEAGINPGRLIFEPIEKAIAEIEDSRKGTDIKITPFYDHNYKHISEYLAGYLQIELDKEATNYMEQRAIAQEEEYKKERKRIEKAKQKIINKEAKKEA